MRPCFILFLLLLFVYFMSEKQAKKERFFKKLLKHASTLYAMVEVFAFSEKEAFKKSLLENKAFLYASFLKPEDRLYEIYHLFLESVENEDKYEIKRSYNLLKKEITLLIKGRKKYKAKTPFILASTSKARKKLFTHTFSKTLKNPWTIKSLHIDESPFHERYKEDVMEMVKQLAHLKARKLAKENPQSVVLGFDTMVYCDEKILGKPKNLFEAKEMLLHMRGKEQFVVTGFAISCEERSLIITDVCKTVLFFEDVSDDWIDRYLLNKKEEVLNYAGAYAFQKKEMLLKILTGSKDNVVGLPIVPVLSYLLENELIY